MAGRTHSTRSPHRFSRINARDLRALIAQERVANADLRKVIYSNPNGKGFHDVTNPVSGERYTVADGLGGATLPPGAVAGAASFSGSPGEWLILRPPGGFGASLVANASLPPFNDPTAPTGSDSIENVAMCFDHAGGNFYLAQVRTHSEDAGDTYFLDIRRVNKSLVPHADPALGVLLASVEIPSTFTFVYSMTYIAGSVVLTYHLGNAEESFIQRFSASTGEILAEQEVAFYPSALGYTTVCSGSTCVLNGHYYAVEPVLDGTEVTTFPFRPNQRLVRRDPSDLSVLDSYTIPSVAVKAPFASVRYNQVLGMFATGGAIKIHRLYQKQPVGGDDVRVWSQDFDASLTPGLDTVTTFHSDPATPEGGLRSKMKLGSSDVVYASDGGGLHFGTFLGWTETVLDPAPCICMDPMTTTKYVLLRDGDPYSTVIVNSDGSEETP